MTDVGSQGIEAPQMSLADIAGLDVSDVAELRAFQIPIGMYVFECEAGRLVQMEVNEGTEIRYVVEIPCKVVEVQTIVEKGFEPEEILGKTHVEKFFIDPAEAQKGIGYAKGFVADIGASNAGNMGGVEGAEPGYLDALAGHRFPSKVIKQPGRKGGNPFVRLQLPKKPKAT